MLNGAERVLTGAERRPNAYCSRDRLERGDAASGRV